ncbi:MAG: flagellar brake protein [Lachnospirales bacterium]
MLYKKIKPGNMVEIALKLDDDNSSKVYVTKVENVESEEEVYVNVPFSMGQLVKLPISENYTMLFIDASKSMHRFDAAIREYADIDGFKYMKVALLSEGKRVQRREYYRYAVEMDLKFYAYVGDKIQRDAMYEGQMIDLGGGGVKFVSDNELMERDLIQIVIILNGEFIISDAIILSVEKSKNVNFKYEYRVKFDGIVDVEREKIVKFVFTEQRKEMKRISKTDSKQEVDVE